MRAEGNAGNQIKMTGPATIENIVLVGNCAFFEGQPFTYLRRPLPGPGQRPGGLLHRRRDDPLVNATVYGQGDGLLIGGVREGRPCTGNERLIVRSSVFVGDDDYFDPTDITYLYYDEECAGLRMDSDYNLLQGVKNVECGVAGNLVPSGSHDLCAEPGLAGPLSGAAWGMAPGAGSPAIDSGDS